MSDIVEKLKEACVIDRHYGKSVTLTLDYDDYMDAADTITALRAEVAKLRAALRESADELDAYYRAEYPGDHPYSQKKLKQALATNPARAALEEKQ